MDLEGYAQRVSDDCGLDITTIISAIVAVLELCDDKDQGIRRFRSGGWKERVRLMRQFRREGFTVAMARKATQACMDCQIEAEDVDNVCSELIEI